MPPQQRFIIENKDTQASQWRGGHAGNVPRNDAGSDAKNLGARPRANLQEGGLEQGVDTGSDSGLASPGVSCDALKMFSPFSQWLVRAVFWCAMAGCLRGADAIAIWATTEDRRLALTPQPTVAWSIGVAEAAGTVTIEVRPSDTYQQILGMGGSFEHTTCSNLIQLPSKARTEAIRSFVDPRRGIGMNLMRLCIGTSDFCGEDWYSYDDVPRGQVDPELTHFSIAKDRAYILPIVKEARRLNPKVLFYASPWSPPGWMKTTGNMIGGEVRREWYPAYAAYFVKYIQAYAKEGIPIHAVTVQNEPGVDRSKEKDLKWHYPSCRWSPEQERDFIRDHLGPAFRRAGLKTEIWCYDHNYNVEPKTDSVGLEQPRTILRDPAAAAFVAGVGFHHYEGQPSGMTQFHQEFPGTPIYFTEGSVFSIWGAYDLVERFRNWASSYNAWVMVLDEQGRPNNGPFPSKIAMRRMHSDTKEMESLFEYYNYGHFMKFVQRGATRIGSEPSSKDIPNVAFRNPDGTIVVVVANTTDAAHRIDLRFKGRHARVEVPAKGVITARWKDADKAPTGRPITSSGQRPGTGR